MNLDDLDPAQRQRWAAARVWAAGQAPYLASAVLALEPVVVVVSDEDLRAFPADPAWHVYLDPAVLDTTEVPEVGFWLLHQVTHLLRRHPDRYPGADAARWNVAADAEIDDDLRAGELRLPPTAITPSALGLPDGWLAEQYYDALPGREPPPQPRVDCGSGADGVPRPWDCGRAGRSAVECRLLEIDVARRIAEHVAARGDIPAGWQRWAREVLEPAVDWRRVLRSAIRRGIADVAGRVDFTYRRPSRRSGASPDVVLPSLRQPRPVVAVVIDTSGSMSDGMLEQTLGEVAGLLTGLGIGRTHLHVVCCDAQAHPAQRVLDARQVRLLGGGGTDMRVGLDAAAALVPAPDVVIVLTDGHTPWPQAPPRRTRVVVGLMDPRGSAPGWATTVRIEAASA
ncbi:MAG TPA: VWA-like domain-containing protein [Pseudonocardiaceae bacterium]|nr:VWA-like domain-containing protein [Pseudonocardiaceae bacterium]